LPRDAGFASDFIEHGAAQPPINAHPPQADCAFPTCPAIARSLSEGDGGSA
jgi:hypothetical protein